MPLKLKDGRRIINHMLVIRLFRIGKKNQPSFKLVVTKKSNPPRGGRFVEEVGFYNSVTKEKILKKERVQYWLGQGAQPSATVHNLLVKEEILEGKKIPVHKKSKKKETAHATEKPAEAPKPEEKPTEKPKEEVPREAKPAEKAEEKVEKPKEEKKEEAPKSE